MNHPKALNKGDTIGIISVASCCDKEAIDKAVKSLTRRGYNVYIDPSCHMQYGYLSGNDKARAMALNNAFANDKINGIFCLRGGYGSMRILDLIDYNLIAKNPKVFIGYSDITALHIAINQKCYIPTLHGPMASAVAGGLDEFTKKSLFRKIETSNPSGVIKNPKSIPIKTMTTGTAKGILCGGNLSLIASTLGTTYEIDTKGKILLLEDVSEALYRVDRMLVQLKLAKKLQEASGIVFGTFSNITYTNDTKTDFTLTDIITQIISPLNIPCIYNVQFGHCSPSISLPLGVYASLDATNATLEVTQALCVDNIQ